MVIERAANPLRLLVVDDRRDAVLLLKAVLARAGHDVTTATDAVGGLEIARSLRPQAIISDLELAGTMDGCDFARAVRGDASISKTHLIAVTGYDDEEHRERAEQAGFDDYLVKPPRIEDLLALLAKVAVPPASA